MRLKILFLFLLFTILSCSNKEDYENTFGNIIIQISDIEYVISSTQTKSIPIPTIGELNLKITPVGVEANSENSYVGDANITKLLFPEGEYFCEIWYGEPYNDTIAYKPYYYYSTNFTAQPGFATVVTLAPTFIGSAVTLNVDNELLGQFISYNLTAESGASTFNLQPNTQFYLPSGIPLKITMNGINGVDEEKSFIILDLNAIIEKTEYLINCKQNFPVISLPQQADYNSYINYHIISPATVSNTTNESVINGLVYEASSDNWNTIYTGVSDGGRLKFINLPISETSHIKYQMRARYGKLLSSNYVEFTTEAKAQLVNGNMNTWSDGSADGQTIYYPNELPENTYWATRNTQTMSSGVNAWYTRCPGARPTTDSVEGSAISLSTVGWGSGNTWASFMWSAVIKNISSGWLVYGDISSEGVITKNREFMSRPKSLTFSYKYSPRNSTSWEAVIELLKDDTVIGSGYYTSNTSVSSYTPVTINITYPNINVKPNKIYVYFSNRTNDVYGKDYIEKKSSPNRYEGSLLLLDNILLTY